MRSGHRSAHLWVVLVCAILAACVLLYGWMARAGRPEPEPLATAGAASAEAGWSHGPATFPETAEGARS